MRWKSSIQPGSKERFCKTIKQGKLTADCQPAACRPLFFPYGITTIIYKILDYLKTLYYDIAEITPAEW